MPRYAIGDLQGCYEPMRRVLDAVRFDPARDVLWSVGDIVNRGPQSLECLRFLYELGDRARVVLGNHDLHLLAIAHGAQKLKKADTLQPVLDAPDAAELLDWLARQPLLYREGNDVLVHAGLAPQWSIDEAERLAAEVHAALRGKQRDAYLRGMYGNEPDCWNEALTGPTRWRVITNYLTRMRFCTPAGALDLKSKEGPESSLPGYLPWFEVPGRRNADARIIFGHWASLLGRSTHANAIALDTGCVWGQRLTLFNLDTNALHHCDCAAH
jgi:bis(5'-nucleosyl)-tetraphosphatase (symmetrical)